MNTCSMCQERFMHWTEYQEHLNLALCNKPEPAPIVVLSFELESLEASIISKIDVQPIKSSWKPKLDLRGKPVYEQGDPAVKREIVARMEKRLGNKIIG